MDWLAHKYINLLSFRLRNFKKKGPTLYNFSCIICGDSENNKNKARGYIYEVKGKMLYHCHNCGVSLSFEKFIKTIDNNLYNEMILEKIKENKPKEQVEYEEFIEKMKPPAYLKSGPLKGLKKVSQLSPFDPIKKFVVSRKIPNYYHSKIFSCPNFMNFTNSLLPNKFDEKTLLNDEIRLLIPFFDKDESVHAYQGRSLRKKTEVKYITIILNGHKPKIFGLDTVNEKEKIYVFEGPIDSMFIENSIAVAGGELVVSANTFDKRDLVLVYDNEPRSKETISKMEKAIYNGFKICIWPENLNHKDINDMILSGMSSDFIKYIIDQHTYSDLTAKLELTKWRKI
jgi:transcription elongation factor Elf1